MKFNCKVGDLANAVSVVNRIIPKRSPQPILSNILIRAERETLQLIAYDLSLSLGLGIEASVDEAGELTLPAQLLNDLVKKLPPEETAYITIDDFNAKIEISFGNYNIKGMSSEDYPELASPGEDAKDFEIESEVLERVLSLAQVAVSHDETKQVLCGVNVQSTGSRLKFAATDSHRLITTELEIPVDEFEVTLPGRSIAELVKVLAATKASATEVIFSATHTQFFTGTTTLITRNLSGQYPAYSQLVPKTFECKVNIPDRTELLNSVERVSVISGDVIKLVVSKNYLKVLTGGSDQGTGEETLTVEAELNEDAIAIGFNTKYLVDALKAIKSDSIQLSFNKPNQPMVFTPTDGKQDIYLLMPVQIRN